MGTKPVKVIDKINPELGLKKPKEYLKKLTTTLKKQKKILDD